MLRLLISLGLMLTASRALAVDIAVEGDLQNVENNEFSLTVTISKIRKETYEAAGAADGEGVDQLRNRLKIILPEINQSEVLPVTEAEAIAPVYFYVEENTEVDVEPDTEGNYTVVYDLLIKGGADSEGKLEEAAKDGTLKVDVEYLLNGDSIIKKEGLPVKQDFYAAAAAPEFARDPIPGNGSLTVTWVEKATIPSYPTNVNARKPQRVTVFLVDANLVESVTLPAFKLSPDASSSEPTQCTFTLPVADSDACVRCLDENGAEASNVYLDKDAIRNINGFQVTAPTPADDGYVIFRGLTNSTDEAPQAYYAFMQYEPKGVMRSTCLVGRPQPDFSLTELNGEDDAKVVDFRCFIATAAYGTPLHADIDLFRTFRDEVLKRTWAGRLAVDAYYRLSPPLADFIAEHPRLRHAARRILEVVADWLRA